MWYNLITKGRPFNLLYHIMVEEIKSISPEGEKTPKPDWLKGMSPQAELIKIWNDVFENNCTCDICVRLRKALSEVKSGPPQGLGQQQ